MGDTWVEDWFLTAEERGQSAGRGSTRARAQPAGARATGSRCSSTARRTSGASTRSSARCAPTTGCTSPTGRVTPTSDWSAPAPSSRTVLEDLAARGVHVRGLLWRSHPAQVNFSEQQNLALTKGVNQAGGEILLDERVRRGGSHHQKLVVTRRARAPTRTSPSSAASTSATAATTTPATSATPRSSSSTTATATVRRGTTCRPSSTVRRSPPSPTPSASAGRTRTRSTTTTPGGARCGRSPANPATPIRCRLGAASRRRAVPHAVQVLRTYPAKRPAYPFAPEGERSIARAYLKALRRARRLVYLEDQYFWSRARRTRARRRVACAPGAPRRRGRAPLPRPRRAGRRTRGAHRA